MRLQRIGFLDGERIGNIRLYYSTKKIDEKANWAIEEKAGDNYNGEDPFTLKKREKKFAQAKQVKKEIKNKLTSKEKDIIKKGHKNQKNNNT